MNKYFLLLVLVFSFTFSFCFGQTTTVDTGNIAILKYYQTKFPFLKNCNQTNISSADYILAEDILRKFINEFNEVQTMQFNSFTEEQQNGHTLLLLDLNRFKRQYVPIINQYGEKEIWINCFCNSVDRDWRKEVIKSSGERMCNFKIMVNLTLNKYYDFKLLPFKNEI